jgi:hypothetical protein
MLEILEDAGKTTDAANTTNARHTLTVGNTVEERRFSAALRMKKEPGFSPCAALLATRYSGLATLPAIRQRFLAHNLLRRHPLRRLGP